MQLIAKKKGKYRSIRVALLKRGVYKVMERRFMMTYSKREAIRIFDKVAYHIPKED